MLSSTAFHLSFSILPLERLDVIHVPSEPVPIFFSSQDHPFANTSVEPWPVVEVLRHLIQVVKA